MLLPVRWTRLRRWELQGGRWRRRRADKREGTKRITVDLFRDEHNFLRIYAFDNDADGMRVIPALLLELAEDPDLSDRVMRKLPELGC